MLITLTIWEPAPLRINLLIDFGTSHSVSSQIKHVIHQSFKRRCKNILIFFLLI